MVDIISRYVVCILQRAEYAVVCNSGSSNFRNAGLDTLNTPTPTSSTNSSHYTSSSLISTYHSYTGPHLSGAYARASICAMLTSDAFCCSFVHLAHSTAMIRVCCYTITKYQKVFPTRRMRKTEQTSGGGTPRGGSGFSRSTTTRAC